MEKRRNEGGGAMTDPDLWVRRFHPAENAAVRVVCLPHAGGSATFYHPMSAGLASVAEVLCVQYPGRQDRRNEPGIEDIATLADRITEALAGRCDKPMALFGHSMGAVLAFEVARRLEARGAELLTVFASGRRSPGSVRDENVHQRDDNGIVAEMKALSGTDARILGDEELLRMILPAIRSDYRAIERYRCAEGAAIAAPIVAVTGDNDPRTTLDEARAWARHTTGDFQLTVLPGGHFFLADHQAEILRLVSAALPVAAR
jgi:surfactin synthase thioesterase subunit